MGKVRVIFDNGGGTTLQLGDWAHYYSLAQQAASDYREYTLTGTTDSWDGHEDDAAEFEPVDDEIRNGGCKVMYVDDIQKAIDDPECESGWRNVDEFITTLKKNPVKFFDRHGIEYK